MIRPLVSLKNNGHGHVIGTRSEVVYPLTVHRKDVWKRLYGKVYAELGITCTCTAEG